jgi:hypothetical protein
MPYLHLVNQEEDIVFARPAGEITTEEVIANLRRLGESLKIPNNLNFLLDLREGGTARYYDDAERIADAYAYASGKFSHKVVVLAFETALYGSSRMIASLAQMKGYDAHAVKTEEEAYELLGIKSIPSNEQFDQNGFKL